MKKKVVFIIGQGHSGSTLLSLILGSHPDCFTVGQLKSIKRPLIFGKLRRSLRSTTTDKSPKVCKVCEGFCPFWNGKVNLNLLRAGLEKKRGRFAKLFGYLFNPYSYLFSKMKEHILIDFSKPIDWIPRQLGLREFKSQAIDSYLLYMTRDGRAVVNSILRKYSKISVTKAANRWFKKTKKMNKIFNKFPANRKMMVRYEELATDPVFISKKICGFLNLEFYPEMIEYWKHDHHFISSNQGAISLIFRKRQIRQDILDNLRKTHGDHYDKIGLSIKLDLRWKDELPPEDVKEFERIAGCANDSFRYEG